MDFLVDGKLIIEIKSVDELTGVHQAQLLTYMKLMKVPIGLLVNFNVALLKKGVKRLVI